MNKFEMIEIHRRKFDQKVKTNHTIIAGVTLIELILVISIMSVIFTVGATTLAFLMRVEMKGTTRIEETLTLRRLSQQFREDAGASHKVEMFSPDNKVSNKINLVVESGASIIYSSAKQKNLILRIKKQANKVVTQNEFRIPHNFLQFGVEKLSKHQIVTMRFQITPEEVHENKTIKIPSRLIEIESLINRKQSIQDQIVNTNKK